MPYITQYYLDMKITDGSAPTKKRVVFFKRSTHEKLLEIPAIDIPANGVIETMKLNKDIAAKDIYAIAFDDIGNRQLAGADKLSIKSRVVWVDQVFLFDASFINGEDGTDKISGTPLTLSGTKSNELCFKDGNFLTFLPTAKTIGNNGLLMTCAREIYASINSCTYSGSWVQINSGTQIGLTVKQIVMTGYLELPKLNITKSYKTISSETSFTMIRIFKPDWTQITVSFSATAINGVDIGSVEINFYSKTISGMVGGVKSAVVLDANDVYPGIFPTGTYVIILKVTSTTSIKYENWYLGSGMLYYLSDELDSLPANKYIHLPFTTIPTAILESFSKYTYPHSTINATLIEKFTTASKAFPFYCKVECLTNPQVDNGAYLSTYTVVEYNLNVNKSFIKIVGRTIYLCYNSTSLNSTQLTVNDSVGKIVDKNIVIIGLVDKASNIPSGVLSLFSVTDLNLICIGLIVKLKSTGEIIGKAFKSDFKSFVPTGSTFTNFLSFATRDGKQAAEIEHGTTHQIQSIRMGEIILTSDWEDFL